MLVSVPNQLFFVSFSNFSNHARHFVLFHNRNVTRLEILRGVNVTDSKKITTLTAFSCQILSQIMASRKNEIEIYLSD